MLEEFLNKLKFNFYLDSSNVYKNLNNKDREILNNELFSILQNKSVVYEKYIQAHSLFEEFLLNQDLDMFGLQKLPLNGEYVDIILKTGLMKDLNIHFFKDKQEYIILFDPFNKALKRVLQQKSSNIVFLLCPYMFKSNLIKALKLPSLLNKSELDEELVESLLSYASILNSSDIHIHLRQSSAKIFLRIDGNLIEFLSLGKILYLKLSQKIKLLCKIDINTTRLPQDGHFNIDNVGLISRDVRVSFYPSFDGESIVLRIFFLESKSIDSLLLDTNQLQLLKDKLILKNGLILVSGPTGSGKSTLLYSCLEYLKNSFKKIITIEDPVEKEIEGIFQSEVKESIGFSFSTALKFILRQDPDIIMVGEIRDNDTLSVALRAALSGHLVIASIHSNNCVDSIDRLKDLGASDFLIKSSLRLIISTRLVKTLCPFCKIKHGEFFVAVGCLVCHGSGYMGREMISESLDINTQNEEILLDRVKLKIYLESNFTTLKQIAQKLYIDGKLDYKESVV